MASTAILKGRGILSDAELCPFDREDLPPLVVAAVGADPMGQLGLPALGAGRERGGRELVVGPALAAAGFRVASLGKGHDAFAPIAKKFEPRGVGPAPRQARHEARPE